MFTRPDNRIAAVALLALALAGAGATAAGAGEPRSTGAAPKVAYLTFDDGPSPQYTAAILDILRAHRARATFFVLGASLGGQRSLARRIIREGHLIGNHTHGHVDLTRLSEPEFLAQVRRAEASIFRATRARTTWLRPPFGAIDARTRARAERHGYSIAMWDVDPQDWRRPSADSIVSHVLARTRPGSVVLLHDGGGDRSQTVAALPRILEGMSRRGYTFETLPQA